MFIIHRYTFHAELAFPHGESHDGSPGFDDFHKAKSFAYRFSLRRSSETLRSPDKCKHPTDNAQYNAIRFSTKHSYMMPPTNNCCYAIPESTHGLN